MNFVKMFRLSPAWGSSKTIKIKNLLETLFLTITKLLLILMF